MNDTDLINDLNDFTDPQQLELYLSSETRKVHHVIPNILKVSQGSQGSQGSQVTLKQQECLKIALKYRCPVDFCTLKNFPRSLLVVLKVIKTTNHTHIVNGQDLMYEACIRGHLDIAICLNEDYNVQFNDSCTYYATLYNRVDMLKYLMSRGVQCKHWYAAVAAEDDLVDALRIIHDFHPSFVANNHQTFYACTEFSSVKCIEFVLQNSSNDFYSVFTTEPSHTMCNFTSNQVKKLDLDKPVWRRLFALNLQWHPVLEQLVDNKKAQIQSVCELSKLVLLPHITKDVIQYCLQSYI
jgi:hypothetical protein